jgi:hypothetical protein
MLTRSPTTKPLAEQLGRAWLAMGDLWSRGGELGLGSRQDAEQAWREAYELARPYLDDPRYAREIQALADELRQWSVAQQP